MGKARKSRKRSSWKKKGKGGLVYKLIVAIIILAILVAGSVVFFRVEKVTMEGSTHYSDSEVLAVSGIQFGGNMFSLNKYEIAENILAELPYISSVQISRNLPSEIHLVLKESFVTYQVDTDSGTAIMNSSGKIMDMTADRNAIRVLGISGLAGEIGKKITIDPEKADNFNSMMSIMQKMEEYGLAANVTSYDISSSAMLTVKYDKNTTIIFSYVGDPDYQVRALEAALEYAAEKQAPTIDLTYADGVHIY